MILAEFPEIIKGAANLSSRWTSRRGLVNKFETSYNRSSRFPGGRESAPGGIEEEPMSATTIDAFEPGASDKKA